MMFIQKIFKKASSSKNLIIKTLHNYVKGSEANQAAAFAYYAFFSLFPLMAIMVSVSSFFMDQDRTANAAINFISNYVTLDEKLHRHILRTFTGMVSQRGHVLLIAPPLFLWSSYRFFNVLIHAINGAWGTVSRKWWQLPVTNLILSGIMLLTLLLGITLPILGLMGKAWLFSNFGFAAWTYAIAIYAGPLIVLFLGLTFFYRLAPYRSTNFQEVWLAGLVVTLFLFPLEILFVAYLKNIARFNVVYGTFGTMVALLTLIYLFGVITILGACLSAAQAHLKSTKI
jgi:YihY family inner membrane protein